MGYQLQKDSLTALFVTFHNGKTKVYYSIDWKGKSFDRELGYKRFDKMLSSKGFLGKWIYASVKDKTSMHSAGALPLHYYYHSSGNRRLNKEEYRRAITKKDGRNTKVFNIALVYNNDARRNGQVKNKNHYGVKQENIPTYYNSKLVYQINIYTTGENSRLVAVYRKGQFRKPNGALASASSR